MTIRKPADDLRTSMPWRWTGSGSSGDAWLSRFCTWTWAMSASVPVSKVRVIWVCPAEVEFEEMYRSPSSPVMFCSMTWVTVFAIVSADAPG